MPTPLGSLMRHAALAACLMLAAGGMARAQMSPLPSAVAAPSAPEFIPRYDFHLGAAGTPTDDEHLKWDTHFGGDIDLVDYVSGRVNFLADYEAVLGNEFRPFDPYEGNYTLELSGSRRVGGTEIAGVFHHVSRHISDRPKRFPIAWNILGVRALRRFDVKGTQVDAVASLGKIVQHSYVDYAWTADLDLRIRRPISKQLGVYVHGRGELYGVDQLERNRSTQQGGMFEGGLRVQGRAGAVELFAGFEQRIDADPFDFQARQWALAGFRLVR